MIPEDFSWDAFRIKYRVSNSVIKTVQRQTACIRSLSRPRTSPSFDASDLQNKDQLARKIVTESDPVGSIIWRRLQSSLQQKQSIGIEAERVALVERLVEALNSIIEGELLWNENAFKGVSLRSKTNRMLEKHDKNSLGLLNRFLIEDAFPDEISAIPDDSDLAKIVEQNGYLLSKIIRCISESTGGQVNPPFVEHAISSFNPQNGTDFEDVLCVSKDLKSGLSSQFKLLNGDGSIIEIGKISTIADDLKKAAQLFPPFFVFLMFKDSSASDEKFGKWRIELGRLLSTAFVNSH